MRITRALIVAALFVFGCGGAPAGPRALQDEDAFARLSAIEGAWRSVGETGTVTADYALVSRGSALVESWVTASGNRTLTVYHPDHASVLLTHYCAQGNQARLRLTEASATRLRFDREDATNVLPDQSILTILVLSIEAGALVRTETYVDANGTPEETVTRFVRAAAPYARVGCFGSASRVSAARSETAVRCSHDGHHVDRLAEAGFVGFLTGP
jgi:hypothetical protein